MRFLRGHLASSNVASATWLLVAALFTSSGCGGVVTVDAGPAESGPEPPVATADPCDAAPFQRVLGSASVVAKAVPWTEPQIVAAGACEMIVAGTPSADLDLGGGPFAPGGLFVARLDAASHTLWTRHFEATFEALAAGADGHVIVSGQIEGSVDFGGGVTITAPGTAKFVVELDAAGEALWGRAFSDDTFPEKMLVDPAGAVLVIGNLEGTADFGGGPLSSAGQGVFVAKYDAAGTPLYSRVFPGATNVDAALDGAGELLLTGTFAGTLDFGGGPLTTTSGLGNRDLYVAKLGSSGEHLWSERFGGPGSNTYLSRVAADGHGGAFLTGSFGGSLDLGGGPLEPAGSTSPDEVVVLDAMFVARLDAEGHRLFDRAFGHGLLLPVGIQAGGANVVVAMSSYQTGADFGGGPLVAPAGYGVFLATLSGEGDHVSSRGFVGASPAAAISANFAVDGAGRPLLLGTLVGDADFGAGHLTGSANGSLFLARIAL